MATGSDRYWPHFFSPAEFGLLTEMAALIHRSASAAARTAALVDLAAANSAKHVQSVWRDQMAGFQELCRCWFGAEFSNLTPGQKREALAMAASEESSRAGQFVAGVKAMAQRVQASVRQDLQALAEEIGLSNPPSPKKPSQPDTSGTLPETRAVEAKAG